MTLAVPEIVATDVHKDYSLGSRRVPALRGVSLSIPSGAFCAITGPSGSGKSTLLNILGLLDTADSGDVAIHGRQISALSLRESVRMRRNRLGFVFQDFNLIPVLSVYENVELPLALATGSVNSRSSREWVMQLLNGVGLADRARHRPAELSGGQQQRVAIARALVNRPLVVLADEPTANLDSETGAAILELMQSFNRQLNTTFVFSTHDPEIYRNATVTIALRDGVVVA